MGVKEMEMVLLPPAGTTWHRHKDSTAWCPSGQGRLFRGSSQPSPNLPPAWG